MTPTLPLEHIEQALHRLALESGNSVKASQALAEDGIQVAEQTLRRWRSHTHRDRYEQIRETLAEQLDKQMAEQMAAITRDRLNLMDQLAAKLDTALHENNTQAVKDLASADRNIGTSAGITTQNNRLIREKPTSYHRTEVTQDELLERLSHIPGLLTEQPVDAEVVPPDQLESETGRDQRAPV